MSSEIQKTDIVGGAAEGNTASLTHSPYIVRNHIWIHRSEIVVRTYCGKYEAIIGYAMVLDTDDERCDACHQEVALDE